MNFLRSITRRSASGSNRNRQREHPSFDIDTLATYGFPDNGGPTIVAHDPVQSLLAFGLNNGAVFVAGKVLEKTLTPPTPIPQPSPITHLAFKTGDKFLIAISSSTILHVWNLQTAELQFPSLALSVPVTCLEVMVNSRWFFVGLSNGQVWAYDTVKGVKAKYIIECLVSVDVAVGGGAVPGVVGNAGGNAKEAVQGDGAAGEGTNTPTHSTSPPPQPHVQSLSLHPTDPTTLLIGYSTGHIITYNITTSTPIRTFHSSPTLTTLAWRPDGQHFVAAYDSYLTFWSTKDGGWLDGLKKGESKPKPVCVRTLEEGKGVKKGSVDSEHRHAVREIVWLRGSTAEDNLLIINGGTPISQPRTLTLLDFSHSKDYTRSRFHTTIPTPTSISSFAFVYSTHSGLPTFVVSVLEGGGVRAVEVGETWGQFGGLTQFGVGVAGGGAGGGRVVSYTAGTATEYLIFEMREAHERGNAPLKPLPLTGGTVHPKTTIQPTDVLVTAHQNGSLQFWHLTNPSVPLIGRVSMREYISVTRVQRVEVDFEGRLCWVVAGPHVVVWRFWTAGDVRGEGEGGMGEEEVERMMREMDETVDGILAGGVHGGGGEGTEAVVGGGVGGVSVGGQGGGGGGGGAEEGMVQSPVSDTPPVVPSPTTPQTPPRTSSTPQHQTPTTPLTPPPRTHSTPTSPTPSHHQHTRTDSISTSTIVIERLSERHGRPKESGWYPVIQGIHMDLVVCCCVVAGGDLVVTATQGGVLHFVRMGTGEILATEVLYESNEDEPTTPSTFGNFWGVESEGKRRSGSSGVGGEREGSVSGGSGSEREKGERAVVTTLEVGEGVFGRDPTPRTLLYVGTESGGWFVYDLEGALATAGNPISEPVAFPKASITKPLRPRHPSQAVTSFVLNDRGQVVGKLPRPLSVASTPPSSEYYAVLVEERSVSVLLSEVGNLGSAGGGGGGMCVARFGLAEGDGRCLGGGVVRVGGDPILLLVTALGWVIALGLPGVEVLWEANLGEGAGVEVHEGRLTSAYICRAGRIVVQTGDRQWKVVNLTRDRAHLPEIETKMYDVTKAYAWARANGLQPGNVGRNREVDALFMPDTPDPTSETRHDSGHEATGPPSGNAFEMAKQQLNERGERLEQLEQKFGELGNSAQSFADKVREYNERQAQKKWTTVRGRLASSIQEALSNLQRTYENNAHAMLRTKKLDAQQFVADIRPPSTQKVPAPRLLRQSSSETVSDGFCRFLKTHTKELGLPNFPQEWAEEYTEKEFEIILKNVDFINHAVRSGMMEMQAQWLETRLVLNPGELVIREGEKLGGGTFPNVYVGTYLGRTVAVKQIKRGMSAELHRPDLSESDAFGIVANEARREDYMHSCQLIHRDLKPANILIDNQNRIRIADVGGAASTESIAIQNVVYTAAYAPPSGPTPSFVSDIYSFGKIIDDLRSCPTRPTE
ncbi:hypothetical protein HDV00_005846 [Rhizophlyctis rosea]|nr:hypothetical protein HDV00_005846 [Rhizophlyctis rosea]